MTGIFGNNFGTNWSYFFQAVVTPIGPEIISVESTDTNYQNKSTDTKFDVKSTDTELEVS